MSGCLSENIFKEEKNIFYDLRCLFSFAFITVDTNAIYLRTTTTHTNTIDNDLVESLDDIKMSLANSKISRNTFPSSYISGIDTHVTSVYLYT